MRLREPGEASPNQSCSPITESSRADKRIAKQTLQGDVDDGGIPGIAASTRRLILLETPAASNRPTVTVESPLQTPGVDVLSETAKDTSRGIFRVIDGEQEDATGSKSGSWWRSEAAQSIATEIVGEIAPFASQSAGNRRPSNRASLGPSLLRTRNRPTLHVPGEYETPAQFHRRQEMLVLLEGLVARIEANQTVLDNIGHLTGVVVKNPMSGLWRPALGLFSYRAKTGSPTAENFGSRF